MQAMKGRLRAWLQLGFGLIILAFLLSSLVTRWEEISNFEWRFRILPLIGAGVGSAVNLVGHGILWTWMLRRLNLPLSYGQGTRLYIFSHMAKYIPGGVWPFATLAVSSREMVLPTSLVITTYVLDMLLGVWASLFFAVPVIAITISTPIAVGLGVTLVICTLFFGRSSIRLGIKWIVRKRGLSETLNIDRLTTYRTLAALLLAFGLLHVIIMVSFTLYLVSWADVSLQDAVYAGLAWLTAWLAGFLVLIAPSGLGVREASLALFLDPILPMPVATTVAVGHRFVMTLVDLFILVSFSTGTLLSRHLIRGAAKSGADEGDHLQTGRALITISTDDEKTV